MPLKLIYPKAYLFIILLHSPDTLSSKKPHSADKKPLPSIPLRIFFLEQPLVYHATIICTAGK